MGTLENTYCKNTEDNLRRYKATGWTHIDKLDEGNRLLAIAKIYSRISATAGHQYNDESARCG